MALPSLTYFERAFYKDAVTIYRQVVNSLGDTVGYAIAPVSMSDATLLQNVPCNFHRTKNFDDTQGGLISAKENNILTANKVTCQYAVDMRDKDLLFITTRASDTEWQSIIGAPQRPLLIQHTHVETVPDMAPQTIVAPPWTPVVS